MKIQVSQKQLKNYLERKDTTKADIWNEFV